VTPARRIEVAAAVLQREDGRFLLAQRPAGKPYAGYWEFPGGKVEAGESACGALVRELHEELGVDVETAYPWITRDYDYQHAAVRLRFFRVLRWRGALQGREGQNFAWQSVERLTVAPLLPANGPVLRALALPTVYGITNAAAIGVPDFLRRAERALAQGLRLVQFREPMLAADERSSAARALTEAAHRHGARILYSRDAGRARALGADGVHLSAAQLQSLTARPGMALVGASCHDTDELERAARLGVDFVVLGPIMPTPSHAEAVPLGWKRFRTLVRDYSLPVFALGGLCRADLATAWASGAHGISMMRGAWD
jgi:8-oxo-dGTP diphosphatase